MREGNAHALIDHQIRKHLAADEDNLILYLLKEEASEVEMALV